MQRGKRSSQRWRENQIMKPLLSVVIFFAAVVVHGEALTTTLTGDTKMEFTKSKSSFVLKAGSVVEVAGRDGDFLIVNYRKIEGRVLAAKTDFKGDVPELTAKKPAEPAKTEATAVKASPPPATAAAAVKPPEQKPADPKPAPPANPNRDNPQSMYGKMVKKARDNEEKHKENLVDPTNEVVGAPKK